MEIRKFRLDISDIVETIGRKIAMILA